MQDDASQDTTIAIVESFKDRLNLKIYQNPTNLGFIKNFESALEKATGELIALCDQDDIWEKKKLETLSQQIGDASLIYSDSALIGSTGEFLNKKLSEKLRNRFTSSSSALHFVFDNSISAHSVLFKTSLVSLVLPFPQHVLFDAYIGAVAASAKGVAYVDQSLVRYRQHATNTLSKQKKEPLPFFEKIRQKAKKKELDAHRIEKVIISFLTIKTLNPEEKQLLEQLHLYIAAFPTLWFSPAMFYFLYTHKETFFHLTKKSKFLLCLKKSLGLKAYKLLPFL